MKKVKVVTWILYLLCFNVIAQKSNLTGWHIEADKIDPNNYYGITVANGIIGLISSPAPLTFKEVVLNGAYDQYGRGKVSNILKGFNFANIRLEIDGEVISADNITGFTQSLDMKKAILTSRFKYKDKVEVRYEAMALRHLPYSALINIEIKANKDAYVVPAHKIEAPDILKQVSQHYAEIDRPHAKIPLITSVAKSPTGKHTLAASGSYLFEEGFNPVLMHEDWDHTMHLVKFKKRLKKGETLSFSVVGSVCTTAHFPDPKNEAERLTVYAMLEGRKRLEKQHTEAWSKLWKSDIIIEGDLQTQTDVRSALYHLYAFARAGTAYSLSPMGLSGLGYNGHVFWDTELWMFPPLLALQPDIARSLLEYRYQWLDAARKNAFAHGYEGAMYPWESAEDGFEATPVWALTGPFEHHISGCIAWASWQYFNVTKDLEWLKTHGFPMLSAIADFWVSRVEKGNDGKFHIYNVVGADEWAENIDDNAFTNGIAITALKCATKAANALGIKPNQEWSAIAANIPILKFQGGITKEHATYNGESIKQADVNLLSFPLDLVKDKSTVSKDLNYYENKIDKKGPAMGHSVLSILHNRLGNIQKSYNLFIRGYKPNEVPPFNVLAETPGGKNPYFATGAGGMLQAIIFGFGGLELTDNGIEKVKSTIPKNWKKLTISGVGVEKKTVVVE